MRNACALLSLVGLLLAAGCGDQGEPAPSAPDETAVAASDVLRRDAYMGVSCPPEPNSYACDRVGLAVWLDEPATRVDASIEGRALELNDPEWSEPPKMFAGFLQPAGLVDGPMALKDEDGPGRWYGREPMWGTVDLEITRADGSTQTTSLGEVELFPGWG